METYVGKYKKGKFIEYFPMIKYTNLEEATDFIQDYRETLAIYDPGASIKLFVQDAEGQLKEIKVRRRR